MALQKYGSPEPIEPEADRSQKTAARESWSADDTEALQNDAAPPTPVNYPPVTPGDSQD